MTDMGSEMYDMVTMSWKIQITEVREAADENQDQETNQAHQKME